MEGYQPLPCPGILGTHHTHTFIECISQVRRKNPCSAKYVKMSLQLYQVDYKSYLLDFKSLVEEEASQAVEVSSSLEKPKVVELQESSITGHHTMEFFEMCAALITQLAR